MVFEDTLDDLMEDIGCNQLVDVSTRESVCEWLFEISIELVQETPDLTSTLVMPNDFACPVLRRSFVSLMSRGIESASVPSNFLWLLMQL